MDAHVEITLGQHEDNDARDTNTVRRQLYFSIIDDCVSEITSRFGERNTELAASVKSLWPESEHFLELSILRPLAELIGVDTSTMISECVVAKEMLLKRFSNNSHKALNDIIEILFPVRDAFPQVYSVYAAALTPGSSTASCEASFSVLIRILTPYRRAMTHRRKAN